MAEPVTDGNEQVSRLVKAGPQPTVPPGSRSTPGAATSPGAAAATNGFGLTTATALIIGSIIGVGIFNLPTSLAAYGPISLVSMGLTTIGALALAMLFAALSRRLPADGGPYAYARVAYGNRCGFANAWSYWITAWAGNAAIAVGWVLYVEQFVNTGHKKVFSILLVLLGLWVSAAINLSGVKNMGVIQVVTTILKFFAVGFIAIVGLFYIKSANYHPFNVSGARHGQRDRRRDGDRAVQLPRRRMRLGRRRQGARSRPQHPQVDDSRHAGDRGRVHALAHRRCSGSCRTPSSPNSTAPFSDAVNAMFGGTAGGKIMSILVIISGIGALNGWTMICAEMPLAAAKDGLFPERFKRMSKAGVPAFGIIASTTLASIAMIINYLGLERRQRVHHAGADDGNHRRDPVRVLGPGADQMAPRRSSACSRRRGSCAT